MAATQPPPKLFRAFEILTWGLIGLFVLFVLFALLSFLLVVILFVVSWGLGLMA